MELPPDLRTNKEYVEQFRFVLYKDSEITKSHNTIQDWYTCYNRLACGCHCSANCEQHALDKMVSFLRSLPKPIVHANSADPTTSYAFTLTMPPTYDSKKPLSEIASNILQKGLTNKPYEKASEWAYVVEHTEQGTPHVHGMYRTLSGRRISSKYFNRYWPLWDEKVKLGHGHKGGYHQKTRHDQSYEAYLEKEGVVISSPISINGYPSSQSSASQDQSPQGEEVTGSSQSLNESS